MKNNDRVKQNSGGTIFYYAILFFITWSLFAVVASVAVVASKRGGGNLLVKLKFRKLAAGGGQILNLNFAASGLNRRRSPSSVAVVGRRRRSPSSLFLQNSKFKIWPRGAAKFRISNFAAFGSQSSRSSRRVASVVVVASRNKK